MGTSKELYNIALKEIMNMYVKTDHGILFKNGFSYDTYDDSKSIYRYEMAWGTEEDFNEILLEFGRVFSTILEMKDLEAIEIRPTNESYKYVENTYLKRLKNTEYFGQLEECKERVLSSIWPLVEVRFGRRILGKNFTEKDVKIFAESFVLNLCCKEKETVKKATKREEKKRAA